MQSEDKKPNGMSTWKGIQLCIIAIMALALFYRYANYLGTHTNIPPGGDSPSHNTRTSNDIPAPFYDN